MAAMGDIWAVLLACVSVCLAGLPPVLVKRIEETCHRRSGVLRCDKSAYIAVLLNHEVSPVILSKGIRMTTS